MSDPVSNHLSIRTLVEEEEDGQQRWGPNISDYVDTFEDRIHQAYDDYTHAREVIGIVHEGLTPLPMLESTLAVSENMHREGFQQGENSIPVIMQGIRRYTEYHKQGIFGYYYGFLCIRHLMRMVCVGTLLENSALEGFLEGLDSKEDSLEVTRKLAERSLDLMHDSLTTRDFRKIVTVLGIPSTERFVAFPKLGGLSYEDVGFLVGVLHQDRYSIINIGARGLLPGLGVLLFVLCEMVTINPKMRGFGNWIEAQELMIRYYLVASNPERAILRQLTRFIDQTLLGRPGLENSFPKYQEDAREVIQAFSDMIFSPDNPNLAQVMLLDTAYIIFRFIDNLCTPRVEDCIHLAIRAGLERLWLELDRERHGFMAANRRGFSRQFAGWIFFRLGEIRQRLETMEGRKAYAEALLVDSNILGLAGRTLLMVAMDDRKPELWDEAIEGMLNLHELLMMVLPAGAMNIALTSVVEWKKVWNQLHDLRNGSAPTKVPLRYIRQAIDAWKPMGPAKEDTEICTYPRCPTVFIEAKPMETAFVCSRCCTAKYCNERCHTRHWRMGTSDAHWFHCISLNHAGEDVLSQGAQPRKFFYKFDVPMATLKERPDFSELRPVFLP